MLHKQRDQSFNLFNPPSNTVIVIAGPTAVGKTAVAIELALALGTEIISADSRQCYREMNIGVARPTTQELAQVPHHFIASHSIEDEVSAGLFEKYALAKAETIFQQHRTLVMVGGTGLYIQAFCEGMDHIPAVQPLIREQVIAQYEVEGLLWLQEQVQRVDMAFWEVAEQNNPQRLMRALEVQLSTGRSILDFRKGQKVQRSFNIIKIALEMERTQLYQRIDQRVDLMMGAGLLEEASGLYAQRSLNALQTVGYQEIFNYLDGEGTLEVAVDKIKQHSRNYAKRQLTWFKKDGSMHWVHTAGKEDMLKRILTILDTAG